MAGSEDITKKGETSQNKPEQPAQPQQNTTPIIKPERLLKTNQGLVRNYFLKKSLN